MKYLITVIAFFLISSVANANNTAVSDAAAEEYCKVKYSDNTGTGVYRGQCKSEKPDGHGTVTFYNGDKITGTFSNGIISGEGVYRSANGNTYEGQWLEGRRHGQGVYKWAKGSTYEGEWVDDKRHGEGVFVWANGNRFVGKFRDNKRFNGNYYTSNGYVYKCRLGQCK